MAPQTHVYGFVPNTHVYGLKFPGFGSALNLVAVIMIVAALAVTLAAIRHRHAISAIFASGIVAVRSITKGRAPA